MIRSEHKLNSMKIIFTFIIAFFISLTLLSQVTIPDFILVDTKGNQFGLYNELDKGKTVVLDFFSLQCGSCQTGIAILEDLWQTYDTTNGDVWVWAIESLGGANIDIDDFIIANGGTFPGFNLSENPSLSSFFTISYTPLYFIICPDRTIKSASVDKVSTYVESCLTPSGLVENSTGKSDEISSIIIGNEISVDFNINKYSTVGFEIYDLLGNQVAKKYVNAPKGKSTISFSKWNLHSGYYFIRMSVDKNFVEAERFIIK